MSVSRKEKSCISERNLKVEAFSGKTTKPSMGFSLKLSYDFCQNGFKKWWKWDFSELRSESQVRK